MDSLVKTSSSREELGICFRTPKRLSVTLPEATYDRLVQKSGWEGRSISNLAAFLLERAVNSGG
ncbi:MAG: hypothetical protein WD136_01000 [Cyanobium sp.]